MKRLVLGFDAGCMTCSDIAKRIEEQAGGKLEVRSLYDPQVKHWREQALGAEVPWTPTLIEIGDEKIRAWTGWKMGIHLSSRLGPIVTWRIMQALGEQTSVTATAAGSPDGSLTGLTRRQLLKGGLGGAAVGVSILAGTDKFISPAAAAEKSATPSPSFPPSTGAPQAQRRAKAIVRTSDEFKRLAQKQKSSRNSSFDFKRAIVNVIEDYALVIVPAIAEDGGTTGSFFVNLPQRTVDSYNSMEISSTNGGDGAIITLRDNGQVEERVNVGKDYVVSNDGERMSAQQYMSRLGDRLNKEPTYTAQRSNYCRTIIGELCALYGVGNCAAGCFILGIGATPAVGLGCSIICGIIFAFGCPRAINRICG